MADNVALKNKADELGNRAWDIPGLQARIRKLSAEGIPRKNLDPAEMLVRKQEILEQVVIIHPTTLTSVTMELIVQ